MKYFKKWMVVPFTTEQNKTEIIDDPINNKEEKLDKLNRIEVSDKVVKNENNNEPPKFQDDNNQSILTDSFYEKSYDKGNLDLTNIGLNKDILSKFVSLVEDQIKNEVYKKNNDLSTNEYGNRLYISTSYKRKYLSTKQIFKEYISYEFKKDINLNLEDNSIDIEDNSSNSGVTKLFNEQYIKFYQKNKYIFKKSITDFNEIKYAIKQYNDSFKITKRYFYCYCSIPLDQYSIPLDQYCDFFNIMHKKKIDNLENILCEICEKNGHCSFTKECNYCTLCKLYGHSVYNCWIYNKFTQYVGSERLHNIFGPMYNRYFHFYWQDYTSGCRGLEYMKELMPIYNEVQRKRDKLEKLLIDKPLLKVHNLVVLLKNISNYIAMSKVLLNNDLLLYISHFV
jgi:hypothetical protein